MPQYSIDPQLKQPAYLQLYLRIREDITSGLCPYGSKLPPNDTWPQRPAPV